MLKLSQFSVVHNLAERGLATHNLVFNTRTSKSLVVTSEVWETLVASFGAPAEARAELRAPIERLVELGIAVRDDTDERAAYGAGFDAQRFHPKQVFPIFAVTTACNIGCTYCYEAGVLGKTMTPKVIDGIARWVEERMVVDGIRTIVPLLFGGEPLLYPKLLYVLMDRVNEVVARYGGFCQYTASSNGMRMTDELAAALAQRGLVQIQISLDGPKCVHDERRIGKRGEPSFDQALRGIRSAATAIRTVTVKVNFDRHNRGAIAQLFDDLVAEGLAGRIKVKLEAVAFQAPDSKTVHPRDVVIPPESEEMANAYTELILEAKARGIAVERDTAHTTPCMMSSHHGVAIGPDGSIVKCISLVGRSEFAVGNVLDTAQYDSESYASQMNVLKRLDECFEERCPYVPVCAGGCTYESVVRTGRYDLRFCTKPNLRLFHFQRQLMRHEKELVALGMRPLAAREVSAT
ncbi:MAG: radical SAM protein [Candidatus Eremiobacteraeota bacterium]|nr:radical SAM protein [Candidatus Eremiobacteraeota bacterium]